MIQQKNIQQLSMKMKSIFDPNFIPNKVLHRDEEIEILNSIMLPAFEENFGVNILITGTQGIGKTVLSNYSMKDSIINMENRTKSYFPIKINCAYKNELSICFNLMNRLDNMEKVVCELDNINEEYLWHKITKRVKRIQDKGDNIILQFDEINLSYIEEYQKIMRWSKDNNITTITNGHTKFIENLRKDKQNSNWVDAKIHLRPYSTEELFDIINQRSSLAFSESQIKKESVSFIVDLVSEFDLTRPSTCIEILKTIYPVVKSGSYVTPDLVRKACSKMDMFDFDSYELISNGVEISRVSLCLASGVSSFFKKNSLESYISLAGLWDRFILKCEEFNEVCNREGFQVALGELQKIGWISPSQSKIDQYYTLIEPEVIEESLDLLLSP
ncbi:MAG: hypothetical protein ACTSUV_05125 [Candidatus Ranarchaeia archaeon]